MSVHEAPVGATVEWYTPKSLFDALGLTFDLDPASPVAGPVSWVPAKRFISVGGEDEPWRGRVWLNPPYGPAGVRFIVRMIEHNNGLMLLPARTETRIFQAAARTASRVIFLADRLHFVRPDGSASRASFGSVLMAFGHDIAMLLAVDRATLGWTATGGEARAFLAEVQPEALDVDRLAKVMCGRAYHTAEYHKGMEVGRDWICHFHRGQTKRLIADYEADWHRGVVATPNGTPPDHGDHPRDSYSYDGCPACDANATDARLAGDGSGSGL